MADLNTDATPLLSEEKVTTSATSAKKSATILRFVAVAAFLCLGAIAAVTAQRMQSSGAPDDIFGDAHLGGSQCDGTCPALPERDWKKMAKEGSAHVLILGDSTDKLWHKSFCNELLAEEQRCVSPDTCATPSATFLPNNMQPFVCVEGDDRCSERTCYATPSEHCWKKEEQRAAAACKPPVAEGPAVGFVHIFGAAPDYVQNMEAINNQYNIEGLPIKIKDRVKTAVRAFDSYTERRPIVVVVDVAYWWAGSHMGWWKKWDADLGSRKKFAAKLDEYTEDMDQLVRLVDKEMKKTGRPYALVGKSNHNRGFRKGTVNFKFMVEMGEAVKRVFEKHGHHFYDWRGIADDADKKGEWTMVDKLHQTSESNALQTAAFMKWTGRELGKEFAVNLDAQEKALAKAEEARRLEREEDAAEARRAKREEKKKAEAAAQKAKDEAEWEAAEEERRQREAAEAAAKEAEDQEKLEQAQQEAMSTLNNIRGYLRGSIANILEPKEGAGALGARRPSSAAAAMAEAD